MNDGQPSKGVVGDFTRRMQEKNNKRSGQLAGLGEPSGGGMDELFKPDAGPMKPDKKPKKPELGGGKPSIDLGDEMGEGLEEKSPLDEVKSQIETTDLSVEDLDELCDFITQRRIELTEDGLDTEMDRGEAEGKDDMRKDKPLGEKGNATMGYPSGGGASGGGGAMGAPKMTGSPA